MSEDIKKISLVRIVHEAISSLRSLGRRSLLALLGIAIGCASIIALLNIGNNAAKESMKNFADMGTEILIASLTTPSKYSNITPLRFDEFDLKNNVHGVVNSAPLVIYPTQLRITQQKYGADIVGTTPNIKAVMGLHLKEGRFLSSYDKDSNFIVAGAGLANEFQFSLGDQIQIENYIFELVGVLESQNPSPMMPIAPDRMVLLSIDSMSRLMSSPEIGSILTKMDNSDQLQIKAANLQNYLEQTYSNSEVSIQVPNQLLEGMAKQSTTFTYLLAGMGAISLLVGGVGVMNVMLMNVNERRKEIGIRMAIGARTRDIRNLFLYEALTLSLLGSILGAFIGVLIAYIFVYFSGWAFTLSWRSIPLGVFGSLIIGLFFGVKPALTAARLHPMKALRDD